MALITVTYLLAGPVWWTPVALSFAAGLLFLIVVRGTLVSNNLEGPHLTIPLCVVAFLVPVPALVLSGMEHLLHIALAVLFVQRAVRFLSQGSAFQKHEIAALLAVLGAMTLVRYESLFLAGIFTLLLLFRRQWLYAFTTIAVAFLPLGLLGWISVAHGWSWLPNSLLLKGNVPSLSIAGFLGMIFRVIQLLWMGPHLAALLLLLIVGHVLRLRAGDSFWTARRLWIFFAAGAILLQLQFASIGWFFRYEAWVMALGLIAVFVNGFDLLIWQAGPSTRAFALWIVLLPMALRGADALFAFPRAGYNIFQQQYQMALFLKTYYAGASIAANDIGAINFLSDLRCLDLAGLCDRDILRLKRRHAWDTATMDARAASDRVRIAIVYDSWFDGVAGPRLPVGWRRVAKWRASDPRFLGAGTVSFYAVHPGETAYLARSLREFNGRLPVTVRTTLAADDFPAHEETTAAATGE